MADTELWLADLDKAAAALDAVQAKTPRLPDEFLQRLNGMAHEALRRERRLAHIALRILLEARLGPGIRRAPFVRGAAGKPALAGGGAAFSLAHTRGLALIAIGDRDPLGADIERMRPVRIPEVRRVSIEREAVALAAGAPLAGPGRDARFLSAWVRIEAAAKAHGSGVGPILERLRPGREQAYGVLEPRAHEPARIVVYDVPVSEGVFAAAALAAGSQPPALHELPDTITAIEALLGAAEGTRD